VDEVVEHMLDVELLPLPSELEDAPEVIDDEPIAVDELVVLVPLVSESMTCGDCLYTTTWQAPFMLVPIEEKNWPIHWQLPMVAAVVDVDDAVEVAVVYAEDIVLSPVDETELDVVVVLDSTCFIDCTMLLRLLERYACTKIIFGVSPTM
jgi:hypothetical protein